MIKEVKVETIKDCQLHVSVCDAARAKITGVKSDSFFVETELTTTEVAIWFTNAQGKIVKNFKIVVDMKEATKQKEVKQVDEIDEVLEVGENPKAAKGKKKK